MQKYSGSIVGVQLTRYEHVIIVIAGSLPQPMGEALEVDLEVLAVVPPRLSVHAGRGFSLQVEISRAQRFKGVDVVVVIPLPVE
jgi:hypothetical protein